MSKPATSSEIAGAIVVIILTVLIFVVPMYVSVVKIREMQPCRTK